MASIGNLSTTQGVALSSEERLALENIMLGEGFSDSSSSEIVQLKRDRGVKKKKCATQTTTPKNRDAMGNYVPPPGKEPLSKLGTCFPGPDYYPNYAYVMKTYPQYTLGGQDSKRPAFLARNCYPGPNRYKTNGDMKWGKCRSLTIKPRIPDHCVCLGPGPTSAKLKPFKSQGPEYTMPGRIKKPTPVFRSNPHVMTLDPSTPGPEFKPSDDEWLTKPRTLGFRPKDECFSSGPGPGKYNTETAGDKRGCLIGHTRKGSKPIGPGPGRYKLKTTMGKGPKAPLGLKYRDLVPESIPGPDVYHRAGFRLDEPGYTMKYRWFDSKPSKAPGPANYYAVLPSKGPSFSIKSKATDKLPLQPGPADYDPATGNWDTPGKSIGSKPHGKTKPANAKTHDFLCQDGANKLMPSVPAFTFRKCDRNPKHPITPGPNAYRPRLPTSKQTVTLAKKLPKNPHSVGPGPALPVAEDEEDAYDPKCPKLLGGPAASLKSRHTPLKYSGRRSTGQLPPAPKEVACAPLLSE